MAIGREVLQTNRTRTHNLRPFVLSAVQAALQRVDMKRWGSAHDRVCRPTVFGGVFRIVSVL